MDKVFKALADKHRRLLLDRLNENNGQTLNELCEHMGMTRQGVSKHLKILEESNLVITHWQGRDKLHYLNPVPLRQIYDRWLSGFDQGHLNTLLKLKSDLENL